MISAQREINHKLEILKYAKEIRSISKTCRYFGISRQVFTGGKGDMTNMGRRACKSKAVTDTF